MNRLAVLPALFCALLSCLSSCTVYTTAREWNGRVGRNGKPIQAVTTTKLGLQLFIGIPFMGDCTLPGMVDDATEHIEDNGGDRVEIAYFHMDNFWYSLPPLTWFVTPIWSQITVEYEAPDEPDR